jgi:hypothetical protein
LAYAQCHLTHADDKPQEFAADLMNKARRAGEESKNPWVTQAADFLERQAGRRL